MRKAAIWATAAVLLALGVWACNGNRKLTWDEQTFAPGYGAIVVKRTALYESHYALGEHGGWLDLGETAQLIDPSTQQPIGPPLKFRGALMLVERNPATKRFNLTAALISCAAVEAAGHPVPEYLKWELSDDGTQWMNAPIEANDIGKSANLLTDYQMNGMPEIVADAYRKENQTCYGSRRTCKIVPHKVGGC